MFFGRSPGKILRISQSLAGAKVASHHFSRPHIFAGLAALAPGVRSPLSVPPTSKAVSRVREILQKWIYLVSRIAYTEWLYLNGE